MATPKIPVRLKGETTCFHHKGKQLELYCEKCQEFACVICVATFHKGHWLCELSAVTREKKQKIRNFVDRTEQKELVEIGNYITSTYTLLKENDSTFENLAKQLKEQTERLKEDLDKLTSETLSLYQKMREDNTKLIQKYTNDLEMHDRQLKKQMQDCKRVLQQGSDIEIFDTECKIDPRLHLPVMPTLVTVSFTPNLNPRTHLKLALGLCQSDDLGHTTPISIYDRSVSQSHGQGQSSTRQKSDDTRKKVVTRTKRLNGTKMLEQWESPCGIISICPTNDDRAWTSRGYRALTLLNRKGSVIQKITHNTRINDISLSRTTHKLWVCDDQHNILELESGQLSERFRTNDEPRCICVTSDNHVIIGMSKHITKYTTQGQIVLTTEVTGTVIPLVYSPWRITECPVTNNIAVVDHSYKDDGGDDDTSVVVMNSDFRELFIYRGDIPTRYNKTPQTGGKPFDPSSIVYDSQGNIIIADWNKDKIILLKSYGVVLKILHTDTDRVCASGVSRQDLIWTANEDHTVKIIQYYE